MPRATLSTHVLDTTNGVPAAGVDVSLYYISAQPSGAGPSGTPRGPHDPHDGALAARATTGADGRITRLGEDHEPGRYRLVFDVGAYFRTRDQDTFVGTIALEVRLAAGHQHIPLLVSRYSVASYLGS